MVAITSTESSLSGTFINLGDDAADTSIAQSCLVYFRRGGTQENNFGYFFGRTGSGNTQGVRCYLGEVGGGNLSLSGTSSGDATRPFADTVGLSFSGWAHFGATWDGGVDAADSLTYYASTDGSPLSVVGKTTVQNGSGSGVNGVGKELFLLNRKGLGRAVVGDVAYIARWNRILTPTEFQNAQSNGPLSEPSGLILCWANQQDYSANAYTPVARSTHVAGALPPNTDLGGSTSATGSGALSSSASGVSGNGIVVGLVSGNGTLVAGNSVVFGTGAVGGVVSGTGSIVSEESTVSGAGKRTLTGVGAVSSEAAVVTGIGDVVAPVIKGATITLYEDTISQASITGIRALWWDSTEPSGAPVFFTTTASTDASGVLTLDLDATTALNIDDPGFLLLYKLDGTDHRDSLQFAGRVAVEDIG